MQLIAKNKTIDTSPIYYLLIEGEHNADNIDFVVDRYYSDDVSVEDCTFIIKGVNSKGNQIEQVLEKSIYDDKVILKWTVSRDFTATAGILKLEIRGVIKMLENETLVIKYSMPAIEVRSSGKGSGLPDIDLIEQAVNSLQLTVNEGITNIHNFVNQQIADLEYPYIILTQAEYDALSSIDETKLYVIAGD